MFALLGVAASAKPRCQGFNNYDNKVTVVFTDDEAKGAYTVTDAKFINCGREYAAESVQTSVKDGVATVTLTFPHLTQFSNPKVRLCVNGKKKKFNVCQ